MGSESRLKSSVKNMSAAMISQIVKQILEFVVRTIFIKTLAVEYLGVNGLFTNLLTYLSLAELGVGSALIYSMYAPMAQKNTQEIKTYMNVYKKIYRAIGVFVIAAGCVLAFCLDFFVTTETDIPYLKFIFVLYVVKTAASYFLAYKKSIYIVDQKQYIVTNNSIRFEIILAISRILVLILLKNYYIYLVVSILCVYAENITISYMANKAYPYLVEKDVEPLPRTEQKRLFKNVAAMFLHKVSDVVLGSTDNIILSKLFGLVIVGLYSNYQMIINVVKMVFDMVVNGIVPSVGNFCAAESKEKTEKLFNTVLYVNIWVIAFCCTCLYNLLTPFVTLWIGTEYVIDTFIIQMLVLALYVQLTMRTIEIFRTATGMFYNDKFYALLQCIINIFISIVLAKKVGPAGIFAGTAIAILCTKFWRTPKYIYNEVFNKSVITYFKKYFGLSFIGLVGFAITTAAISFFQGNGIAAFIVKMLICLIVPNLIFLVTTFWTDEFKDCLKRGLQLIIR